MKLKRDIIYNLLFVSILSIYAVEVCPHVSELGLLITIASFFVILIPLFLIRYQFSKKQKNKDIEFAFNLSYFSLIGLIVGLFNFSYREFPIESAFKIVTGAIILGIINALIYSLESPFVKTKNRISFVNRLTIFFSLILALICAVWILLMKENLSLFNAIENGSMIDLVYSMISESLFVWLVIILYFLRLIHLYKANLNKGIESQIVNLNEIRKENLDISIPRFSNDEFSIIGDEINQMIVRLRHGKKIEASFQKMTGNDASSSIIERISESDFTSEQKEMAVLFTDIKGFTVLCEESEPVKFVRELNNHFEKMVNVVQAHNGIINKFIGDALLVYFEGPDACTRAVNASFRMIQDSQFDIGIGIHHGKLLAGLIGCKERMEYSIIGSVVNKSARLESATRLLETDLVISKSVAMKINIDILNRFKQTSVQLKGFEENETVYYKSL